MIHNEPAMIRSITIRTPNASAMTLLTLSGPVVMCRKNVRWTPICAIASTVSATGMLGVPRPAVVPAMKNDTMVSRVASAKPDQIAAELTAFRCVVRLS